MLTVDDVRAADLTARKGFEYVSDGPRPEQDNWRSHAKEALAGKHWTGDCDDLASTALDVLIARRGFDILPRCFRLQVQTSQCPSGVPFDHMVAGVMVGSELWIIGDTFGHAYPWKRCPHRIINYSRLSDGVIWRKASSPSEF